jgi:phosphoglycerate kinase
VVIADEFKADAASKTVPVSAIPDGWMGLDIGPDSLASFKSELSDCQTVVWNGEWDMTYHGMMMIGYLGGICTD